ncbi:cytochrome b-c1 complex subunit 6, mitochondrial-like isoform X2 [Biomphalaria glabrata]|uniref:Cytochrome b-c1 complex subunit 6, mitochondrial-like isoform X2 n=1 Tax=Biomphalaria glabrata TaxID=6526 RepID=A0A9W3AHE1_BIOGL|nr:cytochrome b-c1 complex subunit 6, mitochondrial-like isoform X2 [Biomphalaria glabrata]
MGLGDKVIAASSPKEEVGDKAKQLSGEESSDGGIEGDEDCFCLCFCDDDADKAKDKPEDNAGSEKGKCECYCICAADSNEEESADLVDPFVELKEKCAEKPECAKYKQKLDECTARVESRSKTAETCTEELIDFLHCVDHCASKCIFSKLK